MARTWQIGDLKSSPETLLNQEIRDALVALDQHQHTGVANEGDSTIGPIDKATLADQAANPSTAGRLQRNGVNLVWGAANYVITNVDDVAGTACLRTLGTGAQQAAAGNHSHA